MKLNAAKTIVLHVGYESDPEPILTLDGTTIDVCDIYNYFDLLTLFQCRYTPEIRRRLSAIGKLRLIVYSTAPDALNIKYIYVS